MQKLPNLTMEWNRLESSCQNLLYIRRYLTTKFELGAKTFGQTELQLIPIMVWP